MLLCCTLKIHRVIEIICTSVVCQTIGLARIKFSQTLNLLHLKIILILLGWNWGKKLCWQNKLGGDMSLILINILIQNPPFWAFSWVITNTRTTKDTVFSIEYISLWKILGGKSLMEMSSKLCLKINLPWWSHFLHVIKIAI